jgi:drug/metabolite transporter (DMT)-like permease
MTKELKAFFILLIIPLLWGITFPILHKVVADYSPSLFVLWRFILATILILPLFIASVLKRQLNKRDLSYGFAIGVLNSGAFVFQGYALLHMSSSQAAFLTGINVVMVPFLLPLFGLKRPQVIEIVAACLCLYGIYWISDAKFDHLDHGDGLIILSALCIALAIIVTERASSKPHSLKLLTFYQIVFTILLPAGVLPKHDWIIPHSWLFWFGVIYCAIAATVIPLYLQMKYQKYVGSNKVAIIFSLESLTATLAAYFMGETINHRIIIGGGIILLSSILVDLWKLLPWQKITLLKD